MTSMKEIFAQRLLSARKQAGLSQDELVARINGFVKKTSIAKYERAEMMADNEVIEELARALNVKVEYFFKPISVAVTQVRFRKKADLGKRKEVSLQYEITSLIEGYLELERLLNESRTFSNPLREFTVNTPEDAEAAAFTLSRMWHIGYEGIGNVMNLIEDNGILVIEIEADDKFDGYSGFANEDIPVIVLRSKGPTTERKRFSALHELAHLLLVFGEGISDNDKENLCNRFAAAMLLPHELLIRELGRYRTSISVRELGILKDKYGISARAIILNALQHNIISNFTYINLLKFINADRMEMHIGANLRVENPTRFQLLLLRAMEEELISRTKAADLAGLSLDDLVKLYEYHDKPPYS